MATRILITLLVTLAFSGTASSADKDTAQEAKKSQKK